MLRRSYAFEAEGVAEDVIDSLETVEDVVDQNCATPADCDAMLEKVEQQEEKFDGALQDMADAAKDAQASGDSGALAESIEPAMNELREVAEDTGIGIGTAAEGYGITQNDLMRIRSYLVGTREIIENKKAELMGVGYAMESDSGDDDDDDSDDDEDEDDDSDSKSKSDDDDDEDEDDDSDSDSDDKDDDEDKKAEEAFLYDYCLECYLDDLTDGMDNEIVAYAMEGVTTDAIGAFSSAVSAVRGLKKEMKAAEAEGDYKTAAAKARECASKYDEVSAKVSALPQSVSSTVLVNGALALVALGAVAIGKRFSLKGRTAAADRSRARAQKKFVRSEGDKVDVMRKKYNTKVAKYNALSEKLDARQAKTAARNAKIANAPGIKQGIAAAGTVKGAASTAAGKVTGALGTAGGAIKSGASKVGSKIPGHAKAAKIGKSIAGVPGKIGSHIPGGVKKVAGKVGGAAVAGGKVAGKGALAVGAAGGAGAAGSALVAFLKKKQVVDEEGNTHASHLEANDVNAVIAMIRKLCASNKQKYLDYAKQYEEMAQGAASNAAAESFIEMMGDLQINGYQAAYEGFDLDAFYAGFLGEDYEPASESIDPDAFLDAFVNGYDY